MRRLENYVIIETRDRTRERERESEKKKKIAAKL
jgi:hypothetical protein